jgi:allophanate hydrolase
MLQTASLLIPDLLRAYRTGRFTVAEVLDHVLDRATHAPQRNVWITRLTRAQVMRYAEDLRGRCIDALPLYGIPFVIKDNIDLAAVPTSAGCPQFAYTPAASATVVQNLIAAGAIPLGKTNLDQFATGLVGTRSPYGPCLNSINPEYISGGSSAGSAVAVAMGLASFSLGTDTAGSGRVPASFNNIVGLKPSTGRISTQGVVPACRSLDCVSIFALTADDALSVLDAAGGYDAGDSYSRKLADQPIASLRFGVPRSDQLQFFGDAQYARLFDAAVRRLEALGGTRVEIDFEPFLAVARLLYGGPWVAERYAAVGAFIDAHPEAVYPVTRQIITAGKSLTAMEVFEAQYELLTLKRRSEAAWAQADLIMTPTAGTIYRVSAVQADPIGLNTTLSCYTNFVNFFDLAAVAVPTGFRTDGLPFGVTLVGAQATERALLGIAARLHRASVTTLGATQQRLSTPAGCMPIAVCGAHMTGLALNHQLLERGAYLLQSTRTSANYRLFALAGGPPQCPGLARVRSGGRAIELEVWAVPSEHVGSFLADIPEPLGIGKVELADGTLVPGFICEGYAIDGATDITAAGGWRVYLAAASATAGA